MLFGQFLLCIKNSKVTEDNIVDALKIQEELHKTGWRKKLGEILIDMKIITRREIEEYLDLRETLNKIEFWQYLNKMNKK